MNMYKNRIALFLLGVLLSFFVVGCKSGNRAHSQMSDKEKELVQAQQYSDVADSYLRNLNDKNLEELLRLHADHATVENPVGGAILTGKEALRSFYSNHFQTAAQYTRTGPVRVSGLEIAFPYQMRKHVDGASVLVDVIDVFRFDTLGKLLSIRSFWGPFNEKPANE